MNNKKIRTVFIFMGILIASLFVIPLVFILFTAGMTPVEAAKLSMKFPASPQYLSNFHEVFNAADQMIVRAFFNSTVITTVSVALLITVTSMAAFVLGRRSGKLKDFFMFIILAGLMIPPSVVTTIWLLKGIGLYKTLRGIIFIEVALGFPLAAVLYTGFMSTLPRELDEAAFIDGASSFTLFSRIIFPLLKPVSVSVLVLSSVNIFNDFVNPLYFLPGAENATIQLTLYNFMSRYNTEWNLLFMNVLVITIPPFIVFIFFNRQIVGGMVAGALKG